MNRLLFIGPIERWKQPTNGESAKNQILLRRLFQLYDKVTVVDTQNWRRDPICMLKLVAGLVFCRNTSVIISACDEAAYKLITILKKTRLQKRVCYVVIGGGLSECIREKNLTPDNYKYLNKVIVEGESMKTQLNALGISNVKVVPNLKPNYVFSSSPVRTVKPIKFVFLSRIEETKGCTLITNCVKRLNKAGRGEEFEVSFYGRVAPEYEKEFMQINDNVENIHYRGLLDLSSKEGYQELRNNDVFLFPTYYFNEGFPGAIVDAFIAGLPIVATRWHLNTEIVEDGKTGFIIDPQNEEALYKIMNEILDNPEILRDLANNSREESYKYDINKVWDKKLLCELGI